MAEAAASLAAETCVTFRRVVRREVAELVAMQGQPSSLLR